MAQRIAVALCSPRTEESLPACHRATRSRCFVAEKAGWEATEYPMALAYRSDTATPLGMNILMYAATH